MLGGNALNGTERCGDLLPGGKQQKLKTNILPEDNEGREGTAVGDIRVVLPQRAPRTQRKTGKVSPLAVLGGTTNSHEWTRINNKRLTTELHGKKL